MFLPRIFAVVSLSLFTSSMASAAVDSPDIMSSVKAGPRNTSLSGGNVAPALSPPVLYDSYNTLTTTSLSSTSSTPNTFMGVASNLIAGSNSITGFDVYPVNASGTNYNAMKITIYVWDTVNTGAVTTTAPAFGTLLASYALTTTGTFTTGFYTPFESATPGLTPGISLGVPLALADSQIGITVAFQGSINGGTTYASANNLTSLITYGTPSPVTVGSDVLGGATGGYYRNAASEVNGNFVSTLRTLGTPNEQLALRVYGTAVITPEPTTLAGIAGLAFGALRRRRR